MLDEIKNWVTNTFGGVIPEFAVQLILAVAILFLGLIVARFVASIVAGSINRIGFAKSANEAAGPGKPTVGKSIGSAVFWVLMLGVIVSAISVLGYDGLLEPIENMYAGFANYIPQLFGGILVFIFGGILATVAQRAVFSVSSASPLDEWANRAGFNATSDSEGLSKSLSWVVYAIIMVFVAIAALDQINIPAISDPATQILDQIGLAIPKILQAAIILVIAYVLSSFVSTIINNVMPSFGLDGVAKKYGLLTDSDVTLTSVVSTISSVAIMLFGAVEATKVLNFQLISDFVTIIIEQGGSILFGGFIIIGGVIFANIISNIIDGVGDGLSDQAAKLVKSIIIGLAILMGISRMGLDPTGGEFILQAALIILVGLSLAAGIAFGLGGKDWAAKQLEKLK